MISDTIGNILSKNEKKRLDTIEYYIDNSDSNVIYEMELYELMIEKGIFSDRRLLRMSLSLLKKYAPEKYRKVKLDPSLDPPEYMDPV